MFMNSASSALKAQPQAHEPIRANGICACPWRKGAQGIDTQGLCNTGATFCGVRGWEMVERSAWCGWCQVRSHDGRRTQVWRGWRWRRAKGGIGDVTEQRKTEFEVVVVKQRADGLFETGRMGWRICKQHGDECGSDGEDCLAGAGALTTQY